MDRPRVRGDCELPRGMRPCPFVGCRHHVAQVLELDDGTLEIDRERLAIDASPAAAAAFAERIAERVVHLRESCSLDLADRGEHTLQQVGETLAVTRERVRQIETKGRAALRRPVSIRELKLDRAGPTRGTNQ
jgi:Sigma-70, region 4